ncbi:MAG: FGLLP motif-containing membrane protein [Candidatus Dormibacteria bacterium]
MRLPSTGHCGHSDHTSRETVRLVAAGLAVVAWLLMALGTVALASQLPQATSTGWNVVIVNNYSPCNGPIAPGNCHGSAVITTSGAPATANLESVTLGGSPYGAVITPDGSLALVLNILDGTLSPIDLQARPPRVLPPVHIGGHGDAFLALAPDGRTALVADTGSSNVYPLRIAGRAFRIGRAVDVGSPPGGVAFSPDGATAWVVLPANGTIRPINVGDGSFSLGAPVAAGRLPTSIAISPDGTTAYVTSTARNTVTAVSLEGGGITHTIAVGRTPEVAVITPDGSAMYVTNGGSGTVTPVDLSGGTPVARTPVVLPHGFSDSIAVPTAAAITPDGKQLWVTDGGSLVGAASQSGNTVTAFDIRTPMRPVATRTIATGGFEVRSVAIIPAIIDGGSGPSALAMSLPTLADVLSAQAALVGVAIAAGSVLFITFPSQIFNLTLQENYPIIAVWMARKRAGLRALPSRFGALTGPKQRSSPDPAVTARIRTTGRRSELPAFATVIAVGALFGALLDPRFGPNPRGVASYVAIVLAIPTVAVITALVSGLYFQAEHRRPRRHLRALPLGLAVAAICVIISRMVDFQPGYLYGVVCGIALEGVLIKAPAGRVTMTASLVVLAVCVGAWLAWKPVADVAVRPGTFFGLIVLDDFLASLTVGGIVGTAIGLLPLQFLPGAVIRDWSLPAWATTFGVAMILLITLVVRSPLAPVSHSALWVIVALFVLFAGISVGFREYFARRWRREHAIVVRGLRNHVRDLLVPHSIIPVQDPPSDPAPVQP